MKIIKLNHPYQDHLIEDAPIVLALGFFDGIHKGHQKVIQTAKAMAESHGYKLAVMSFNQHPSVIFQGVSPESIRYLSPESRKSELLEELGVDLFYIVNFTKEFASLTPQEFVDQYIVGLHTKIVVAGFDYTYGKRDIANMRILPEYSKNRFTIITIPEQRNSKGKISSTAIRAALSNGNIVEANKLFGYDYEMNGKVVHGFGRGGKKLGYPTANIEVSNDTFLLKNGVYIVEMDVDGTWIPGMASIGFNPTFNDVKKITIEVHLLDFNEDIYDKKVKVKWLYYLRDELKFDSLDALMVQLKEDELMTRKYFSLNRGC